MPGSDRGIPSRDFLSMFHLADVEPNESSTMQVRRNSSSDISSLTWLQNSGGPLIDFTICSLSDLDQFPRASPWHQTNSVLLPCPPHRISPLWEKDHLFQTEQISHLDRQARITSKSPPSSYCYQNEFMSSPWLKHLATSTQLDQSFPSAKSGPLPHLYHRDMAKVSPSSKYQKITSVLSLHDRQDIKTRVALKSFQLTPSGSDHLPKIFPSFGHSSENLLSLNQQLTSPLISDNKSEFSSFLGHGSISKENKDISIQGKDKLSILSMTPANHAKVTRRPQGQVRPSIATSLGSFDLKHKTTVTPSSLCFSHWSRATALKTPDMDHLVQAKASKISYPDLQLRETVSLLRGTDRHSRPLDAYSLHLSQKTRATSASSFCPKRVKSTALPSPGSNFQARIKSSSVQDVKSWIKGLTSHWVMNTSLPLHHQMTDVTVKQISHPSTPDHHATCPPSREHYQVKYITDFNAQVLLQKEKDGGEVMPRDPNHQFTMLADQVYWTTPQLNMVCNNAAPFDCDQRTTTPFRRGYKTEKEPDPKVQGTLQPELNWKTVQKREVNYQSTSPPNQAQYTPEDPNVHIMLKKEFSDWGTFWTTRGDHQVIHPSGNDHQIQDIPAGHSVQVTFNQEEDKPKTFWKQGLNYQSTPPPNKNHQAQDTPEDSTAHITLKQEADNLGTWTKGLNQQTISSLGNNQEAQNMPSSNSKNSMQQKIKEWELFWPRELEGQSTILTNENYLASSTLELKYQDRTPSPETYYRTTPPPSCGDQTLDISYLSPQANQRELGKSESFWPQEVDQQATTLTDKVYWVSHTLDLKHQNRTSPDPYHGATPPPIHEDQFSDISDLSVHTTLQQELGKRETVWSTKLDKEATTITDKVYSTTFSWDTKHQDRTSLDLYHGATPPPSPEDDDSDVSDLSTQAIIQEEPDEWEAFWPTEADQEVTTLKDNIHWTTYTLDLKQQDRTSPDFHHEVTPPPTDEDQSSDVSDLSIQALLTQSKKKPSWSTEVDSQATTLANNVYWATASWSPKHQNKTSPDSHHGPTPSPSHEGQASDVSDLSVHPTPQQEPGKRETFWPTELDKQNTAPTDKVNSATFSWELKHQNRTSPDLHHGIIPPLNYGDKASDISTPSAQATIQQELGERETSCPTELDKQVTTLKYKVYWAISPWDMKHEDRTSLDLHYGATPPPSHGHKTSDISTPNAQATIQQELGERETFCSTNLDKKATTLKYKVYWTTYPWNIKHQGKTSPDLHHGSTSPTGHENQASYVSDLSTQATIQQKQDKWEIFWPTEVNQQTITLRDKVDWTIPTLGLKPQDRTSSDLHYEATPPPSHEHQASDISDLSVHPTFQQELGKRETSSPKEIDKQTTTLKDKVYWDIKHTERISSDPHHGATPLPKHEYQASNVSDLGSQTTLQKVLGVTETSCPTEVDQQDTTLLDQVSRTISSWVIKHQDRPSPEPNHTALNSPSHKNPNVDVPDLNSQVTLKPKLDQWEMMPSVPDQKVTNPTIHCSQTVHSMDIVEPQNIALSESEHQTILPCSNDQQIEDVPEPNSKVTLEEGDDWDIFWARTLEYQSLTPTNEESCTTLPFLGMEHYNMMQSDPDLQVTCTTIPDHQTEATIDSNTQGLLQTEQGPWEPISQKIKHQTQILTVHDQEATFSLGKKYQDITLPRLDSQDLVLSIHDFQIQRYQALYSIYNPTRTRTIGIGVPCYKNISQPSTRKHHLP
ncbi:uncharacterized protein LOC141505578 [Macrotis lagotis]|uniref:uncharacterized protein LOC141505578 n=1 Tax=Macrotis lagotis TaxID=92651 RepID=UPI003D684AA2